MVSVVKHWERLPTVVVWSPPLQLNSINSTGCSWRQLSPAGPAPGRGILPTSLALHRETSIRGRKRQKRKKRKKSELFILIINTSVCSTHTQPSLTLVITPTPKNARQSRFGDVSKDLMLHCVWPPFAWSIPAALQGITLDVPLPKDFIPLVQVIYLYDFLWLAFNLDMSGNTSSQSSPQPCMWIYWGPESS